MCNVTALSKLIEKVSPAKRVSRRTSSGHIRHLSFSPKGPAASGRAGKSPFRQPSSVVHTSVIIIVYGLDVELLS